MYQWNYNTTGLFIIWIVIFEPISIETVHLKKFAYNELRLKRTNFHGPVKVRFKRSRLYFHKNERKLWSLCLVILTENVSENIARKLVWLWSNRLFFVLNSSFSYILHCRVSLQVNRLTCDIIIIIIHSLEDTLCLGLVLFTQHSF